MEYKDYVKCKQQKKIQFECDRLNIESNVNLRNYLPIRINIKAIPKIFCQNQIFPV